MRRPQRLRQQRQRAQSQQHRPRRGRFGWLGLATGLGRADACRSRSRAGRSRCGRAGRPRRASARCQPCAAAPQLPRGRLRGAHARAASRAWKPATARYRTVSGVRVGDEPGQASAGLWQAPDVRPHPYFCAGPGAGRVLARPPVRTGDGKQRPGPHRHAARRQGARIAGSWRAAAPERRPSPLDMAVIGAGPVGLALALHAARLLPHARITLFDARRPTQDVTRRPAHAGAVAGQRAVAAAAGGLAGRAAAADPRGACLAGAADAAGLLPLGAPEVRIRAAERGVPMLGAVLRYGALVAPLQRAWEAAQRPRRSACTAASARRWRR